METMMKTFGVLFIACGGIAADNLMAETPCFEADEDSGELRFSGVADGTPFRGKFERFSVELCMEGETLEGASILVTVDTASGDVSNRDGNEALRDPEFFDVDEHDAARWESAGITRDGDAYRADGKLTIKGISGDQAVKMRLDPGNDAPRLSGEAEIMRLDWDVGTGEFDDPDFIRNRVELSFDLTF